MSKSEIRTEIVDMLHDVKRLEARGLRLLELLDKGIESVELRTLRDNYDEVVKLLEAKS